MSYSSRYGIKQKNNRKRIIIFIILLGLVALFFTWLFVVRDKETPTASQADEVAVEERQEEVQYQSIDLQPTINEWIQKYPADYHIAVYDLQNGNLIGSSQPDTKLFAASLYKIYVAYFSLLDFQDGTQNPNDILVAGQTKKECVDKMIRSSDSPCGEAMMAEIGQLELNKRVQSLGINNTTFNGIQTSAGDSALIIKMIADGKSLNKENTDSLLDSMLTQEPKFKRGLQTGAPEAVWHTKVGWNEDINYHDIGIMTMPDGRKFAVAILGQGSGSPEPIGNFAATIFSALKQ